jgi:hypothetical protein
MTPTTDTVAIATDSATGTQALILTAHPGDGGGTGGAGDNAGMETSGNVCNDPTANGPNACYTNIPGGNVYAEIHWRFNANDYNGPQGDSHERFNFFSGGSTEGGCVELDYIEYFASYDSATNELYSTGGGTVNWCGGGSTSGTDATSNVSPIDSNYHTDSALATANNTVSPVIWSDCQYHDGTPTQTINGTSTPGCNYHNILGNPSPYQQNGLLIQNDAAGNGAVSQDVSLSIAWIRIWVNGSCFDPTQDPHTATNTCSTASPYQTAP